MKKLLILVALAVLLFTQPFSSIQASPQAQNDPVLAKVIDIGKNDNQTTSLARRPDQPVRAEDLRHRRLQQRRAVGPAAVQELGPAGRTAGSGRGAHRLRARRVVREDRRHARQVPVLRHAGVLVRHQGPPARAGRRAARRDRAGRGDEGEAQGRVGPGQRAGRPQSQRDAGRTRAHLQAARGRRRARRRSSRAPRCRGGCRANPRRLVGPAPDDARNHAARHAVRRDRGGRRRRAEGRTRVRDPQLLQDGAGEVLQRHRLAARHPEPGSRQSSSAAISTASPAAPAPPTTSPARRRPWRRCASSPRRASSRSARSWPTCSRPRNSASSGRRRG